MVTLAEARVFQGDPTSAEPMLRKADEVLKKRLPPQYPPVTATQIRLGEALIAQGKAGEAEPILQSALQSVYSPPFRIPAWQVGEAESAMGWCLGLLGRTNEARRLLLRSQEKLAMDPRPLFRKQAADHLRALVPIAAR
jgi:hypothetical protein